MIGTLPSCHAPSKNVQVCEKLTGAIVCAIIAIHAAVSSGPRTMAPLLSEFPKDLLAERSGDSDGFTIDKPEGDASFPVLEPICRLIPPPSVFSR
jgi:hypothetical protein